MLTPARLGLVLGLSGAVAGAFFAGVFSGLDLSAPPEGISAEKLRAIQVGLLGWFCGSAGMVYGAYRSRLSAKRRWLVGGAGVLALGLLVAPSLIVFASGRSVAEFSAFFKIVSTFVPLLACLVLVAVFQEMKNDRPS